MRAQLSRRAVVPNRAAGRWQRKYFRRSQGVEGPREAELTARNPRETTTGEVGGEQGVNQE